jgi:dual specificity phosphatase 12
LKKSKESDFPHFVFNLLDREKEKRTNAFFFFVALHSHMGEFDFKISEYFDDNGTATCIEDGIYLGGIDAARNHCWLQENKITHVLSVTSGQIWNDQQFLRPSCIEKHTQVPVDDSGWLLCNAEIGKEDVDVAEYEFWKHMDTCFDAMYAAYEAKCNLLVHCRHGINRSASMVIAWFMLRYDMDFATALERIQTRRSFVQPSEAMRSQVEKYFADLDAPLVDFV